MIIVKYSSGVFFILSFNQNVSARASRQLNVLKYKCLECINVPAKLAIYNCFCCKFKLLYHYWHSCNAETVQSFKQK